MLPVVNIYIMNEIKQRLLSFGYPEDKVQIYCNDLESYGDDDDYENISDKELKKDFQLYFTF